MAELKAMNWVLEVRYFPLSHKSGGMRYEFFFRYKGEPIVRDALLKRAPKMWEDRTPGAFLAHQQETCSLVPTLKQVLDSGKPQFWHSDERDVALAFYPGKRFPDLGIEDAHPVSQSRSDPERDDLSIAVLAMIDSYNFGNEFTYQGDGPALILHVPRAALQAFYDELQAELVVFLEEYGPLGGALTIKEDL